MRPTRPERAPGLERGVTLIEAVVAMVLAAIVIGTTLYFALPVRQAVDVTVRAELTDIADNALQRIGRDVRLALPNSIRVTTSGSSAFIEFLAIRTAGRYRAESSSAACGAATDELSFDNATPDACFKSIGKLWVVDAVTNSDFLVLQNYGVGFANQNAYQSGNRRPISAFVEEASQHRVEFNPLGVAFNRPLHDSAGRRFFIISGPVTFQCDTSTGQLTRYAGYAIAAAQPTSLASGATIASSVSGCSFDYDPNGVAPQIGLLTLSLTLSKSVSTGTETVTLYHSIHANNVP